MIDHIRDKDNQENKGCQEAVDFDQAERDHGKARMSLGFALRLRRFQTM